MISHFVESYNDFNHGKFLLLRHGPEELAMRSALPGHEQSLLLAGRKFDRDMTFVIDLQTGEGAAFTLESGMDVRFALNEKHRIWVCPMYEPFVTWLADTYDLGRGRGDITTLPRVVELSDAPRAMSGYRRGEKDQDPRHYLARDGSIEAQFDRALRSYLAAARRVSRGEGGVSSAITQGKARSVMESLLPRIDERRRKRYERAIG